MKTSTLVFFMMLTSLFTCENGLAQQTIDSVPTLPFRHVITSENFNHAGYSGDVMQLISGTVPGLSYTKKGSDPNVPATLSVRGYTSEDYPSGVFCIIDGVYGADPRWLSPEDIESFEVIADAAATAAYGSRGRSGVILIKTKSHQGNRKMKVNFATTLSFNQPTKKLDVLSAEEFRTIESVIDEGGSTDWQEEIFRNTGSQNYNLGFSGIHRNANYRISVFHRNNQGIVRGSGAKNTGVHLNLSKKALQNRLTLGTSLHFSQTKNEILPNYASFDIRNNVFLNALYRNPTYPVRNPDGTFHELLYFNPVAILEDTKDEITMNNALMSMNGQYQMARNLLFTFNTGFSSSKSERNFNQSYSATEDLYLDGMRHSKRFNWEAGLSYQKNIDDHHFNLSLKYSGFKEDVEIDDEGTNQFLIMDRNQNITNLVPQIDYRYKNFFLSALLNTEFFKNEFSIDKLYHTSGWIIHSTYPGKEKFTNFFPAIHAGIDLSKEIGFFDEFMVTAVYGTVGHISNEFLERAEADVDMEKTGEISAGINFVFPGQRISGALLYYNRTTKNQIREIVQLMPPFYSITLSNDLKIRNSGIEASVHIIPVKTEKIQWNSSLCFFSNKSLLKSSKSGQDDIRTDGYYYHGEIIPVLGSKPGNAYPSFYMPEITGYDELGNPVYKSGLNGRIYYIKGQPRPKIEMGWNNHICFAHKLTVSLSFRYAGGYEIFNATKLNLSDYQDNLPLQNINHNGLANYESEYNSFPYDDQYLEDASFLRLDNVTIDYAFKPKSGDGSPNLTVFVGADNLFTLTNYDGFDPAGYDTGIDAFNVYPLARTYSFGFRMNL